MKKRREGGHAGLGRTALLCLLSAAVLLGLGSLLLAQERFGGLTGIVKDESGGVLPGRVGGHHQHGDRPGRDPHDRHATACTAPTTSSRAATASGSS